MTSVFNIPRRGHSARIPHLPANCGGLNRQNGQWEDFIKEATAKDNACEWFWFVGLEAGYTGGTALHELIGWKLWRRQVTGDGAAVLPLE
jgi:hypothetical protein